MPPIDLLDHLARWAKVDWGSYEAEYEAAAYGSRPPTRELVERYVRGDDDVVPAFTDLCVVSDQDAGSFSRFQAKANLRWNAMRRAQGGRDRELLAHVAKVRDAYVAQGISHAEFRVRPLPEILASFGNDVGQQTWRVVADIPRDDPWSTWEQLVNIVLGRDGDVVVGVDWSGVESGHPPKTLAGIFREVRAFNETNPERALAILCHVAESFTDKTLESAIRWVQEIAEMGAHRLGHAIELGIDPTAYGSHIRSETVAERLDQITYDLIHVDDLLAAGVEVDCAALIAEQASLASVPAEETITVSYDAARLEQVRRRQDVAMARVRALGTVIEVCPTSNRRIAGITDPAHHPVHRFLGAGLPVVISTDNPGVFNVTLADELDWVCRHTHAGDDLWQELVATGWRSRAECLSGRVRSR